MLQAVAEMRRRIADAKSPSGLWDSKLGPGRMQEIELMAQAGSLMAAEPGRGVLEGLDAGVAIGWLSDADKTALQGAYGLCWTLLQVARLLSDKPLVPEDLGDGGTAFLLRETGHDNLSALETALIATTDKAAKAIDRRLPAEKEEAHGQGT